MYLVNPSFNVPDNAVLYSEETNSALSCTAVISILVKIFSLNNFSVDKNVSCLVTIQPDILFYIFDI